ncbi:Asp-tRNAAsn/Glu-tRNAGln amidotransferase A subunit related amidase [Klebsiella michiganensis]|uniref:Asp-tRNAAsn/Glu-tRNAGln amidotransferase A subunit related amidase n=1 Tax=Klebsiella michiganensis TaxID=1134687 RepID=A0A7H4N1Y3_9ENTR|nr:Asp-tRNAAsn/Glu-tRNAGln amidotransferase A subunit related amidase [Klebsiella michiganensis]
MLAEAENIDTLRREKKPLPALAGVPYAVKNLFDVAGHTTLAGAQLLSDRPAAAADSWAVRQLHSAGALLSGDAEYGCLRLRFYHREQPLRGDA